MLIEGVVSDHADWLVGELVSRGHGEHRAQGRGSRCGARVPSERYGCECVRVGPWRQSQQGD